jgi:hypothetical protein
VVVVVREPAARIKLSRLLKPEEAHRVNRVPKVQPGEADDSDSAEGAGRWWTRVVTQSR